MIKVSVLYPNGDGKTFDMDYYCNKHVPIVADLLRGSIKGATVEKGLAGGGPGAPAPYVVMSNLYFDSVQDFENYFGPNSEKIMGDLPNFTNMEPAIQISEVQI
jgi:uncharacterized protein (TIGR02118 family)